MTDGCPAIWESFYPRSHRVPFCLIGDSWDVSSIATHEIQDMRPREKMSLWHMLIKRQLNVDFLLNRNTGTGLVGCWWGLSFHGENIFSTNPVVIAHHSSCNLIFVQNVFTARRAGENFINPGTRRRRTNIRPCHHRNPINSSVENLSLSAAAVCVIVIFINVLLVHLGVRQETGRQRDSFLLVNWGARGVLQQQFPVFEYL